MNNITNKVFFRNYGFFLLFVVILFTVLTYTVKLASSSWSTKLKTSVETVLAENDMQDWTLLDNIEINNAIASNACAFNAQNSSTGEKGKFVILRVATYYGPAAVVYFADEENNPYFVGYSSLHGRIATQLSGIKMDKRVEYWEKRIPGMLQ